MNAAAAAAISSFCLRLFLFNDILSLLWSFPAVAIRATQPRSTRSKQMSPMDDGNLGATAKSTLRNRDRND